MQHILSLEQVPPLSIPLRFFLTAPLFAAIAGVLLLWHGPEALASRWSPVTLSLVHLLTLGFLSMCMIGALLHILPVVAGVNVPRVRLAAGVIHLFLTLGTIALSAAFWSSEPTLFKIAIPALVLAFAWLLVACLLGLWRTEGSSVTLAAVRISLVALAVTIGLGATAASAFAWPLALPLVHLTDLHASWGLLGWVGLLIVGVAYQVVPMFQVTPLYPRNVTRWLAWGLFLGLGLRTAVTATLPLALQWRSTSLSILMSAGYAAFSITTLSLLWQRKRPKPEATTRFWYAGMVSMLGCIGLWLIGELLPAVAELPSWPLALGILFIVGFGYSITNGMLYKIVPFLIWYHLQDRLTDGCMKAPNVKQIVPDQIADRQFYAHVSALLLLLAATVWPDQLTHLAGAAFIISSTWLWLNLFAAARIYQDTLRKYAKREGVSAAPAV